MSIMFTKKSLFLAARSVAVSPKVRSSLSRLYSLHNLFLHSIYNPPHIKNIRFSTAAQTTAFQSESHEKDRSFDYQHNPSDRFYTAGNPNPTELQQNPSVNYGENPRKLGFFGGRTNETPHNQDAASSVVGGGGNSGYFQENPIENYRGNVGDLLQRNHVRQNQNFNAVHQEYPKSVQGNPVGFENAKVSQQNPSGYYPENVQCQTSYGVYREDPRVVQQGPGSVSGQKSMEFQRTQNVTYGGNVSEFQKNPNAYQFQRNDSGYHQESSGGGFQQNPTWSHQKGVGDFQGSSNVMLDSESVETTESSQYKGTLEELDSLCKEGKVKEAVEVLGLLDKQGIKLDLQRYFQLMNACGEASSLQEAKAVHDHLIRSLVDVKVSVYNKILDMYAKCGSLSDAYEVFEKMPERNLTTWDTMITGLAKNGLGEDAIDLFTRFKEAGLRPDGQMFFGVFSACSILYDIDEGMLHLESMSKVYGIIPSREHYVSVVDMLGSTGYLDEAMEFIEKMSFEPSVEVWETMMNLCRVHGNTELGDRCAQIVEHLDPSRLTDQSKAGLVPVKPSDIAKEKEKKKLSAQNLLEVRSRVHEYRAGDTSHPEKDKIYALLRGMGAQMREVGYVPETRFVLHDIDQEGKEEALLAHSERLAVSYGLISSPARSPIRIIKNLRVCGDCHNALKIISKLVGRELIIRDAKRFHHFKDGLCSCRDYW